MQPSLDLPKTPNVAASTLEVGPPKKKRRTPFNSYPIEKRREPHTAIPGLMFRILAR